MYNIYAYWDADYIKDMLNAVAMLTSMDDFMGLIKVFVILGIFVAVAGGFARARGEEAVHYVIIVAIFYGAVLLPKVDVVVQDMAGSSGTYTVANVPIGLAFFASAESHIGYWLTTANETVFSTPDVEVGFQRSGFMFSSRSLTKRMDQRFHDPVVINSMSNFMKNCINPELDSNPALFREAMNSTDLWGFFNQDAALNPGRLSMVYDKDAGEYVIRDCKTAYTLMTAIVNDAVSDDVLPRLAKRLNPQSTLSSDALSTLAKTQLSASDEMILGISRDAEEGIRQAAIMNQMIDGLEPDDALALSMAEASSTSAYRVMAKLGEKSLPVIRNMLHLLILGLFPIILLLIILAGSKGGLVLRQYVMAILWVNLWAPLYAILSFFMTRFSAYGAQASSITGDALTLSGHQAMMHSLMSDQALAGMLTLSVPVIAYMLTQLSASSMTSVISGVMAPSNSAAQQAGGSVGQGNVGAGNVNWGNVSEGNMSWNNRSANQSNTAPTRRWGASMDTEVGQGGWERTNYGGGPVVAGNSGMSPIRKSTPIADYAIGTGGDLIAATLKGANAGVSAGNMVSRARANAEVNSTGLAMTSAVENARQSMANFDRTVQSSASRSKTAGVSNGIEGSTSTSSGVSSGGEQNAQQGNKSESGLNVGRDNKQESSTSAEGNLRLGGGKGGAAAGVGIGGKLTEAETDSIKKSLSNLNSQDASVRQGAKNDLQVARKTLDRISSSSSDQSVREAAQSLSSRIGQAVSASDKYSAALTNQKSVNDSITDGNTASAGTSTGSTAKAISELTRAMGLPKSEAGYEAAMNLVQQDPQKAEQLLAAQFAKDAANTNQTLSSAGSAPRTASGIESEAKQVMDDARSSGANSVKKAGAANNSKADDMAPFSATSSADTAGVESGLRKEQAGTSAAALDNMNDSKIAFAANAYANWAMDKQNNSRGVDAAEFGLNGRDAQVFAADAAASARTNPAFKKALIEFADSAQSRAKSGLGMNDADFEGIKQNISEANRIQATSFNAGEAPTEGGNAFTPSRPAKF